MLRWTRDELYLGGQLLGAVRAWQPDPGEDYDDDTRSDFVVYRPTTGAWVILTSSSTYTESTAYQFGGRAGDVPLSGDFDGDGTPDLCIYRPEFGTWFILKSSTGFTQWEYFGWGGLGDVPAPGDFDEDGKTDGAVYRTATGEWFVRPSSGAPPWSMTFGQGGDVAVQPVVAPGTPAHPDHFVEYYHLDALGSIRAVTGELGTPLSRHDFLPFGEEWSGAPAREARLFTGKERDAQTGLDYFGARYYAGSLGRFTTINPVLAWQDKLRIGPDDRSVYASFDHRRERHDPLVRGSCGRLAEAATHERCRECHGRSTRCRWLDRTSPYPRPHTAAASF